MSSIVPGSIISIDSFGIVSMSNLRMSNRRRRRLLLRCKCDKMSLFCFVFGIVVHLVKMEYNQLNLI